MVVPAAGRQPHDPRRDAWLPASARHHQSNVQRGHSLFSTACALFGAVVGLDVMPAGGRRYHSRTEAAAQIAFRRTEYPRW